MDKLIKKITCFIFGHNDEEIGTKHNNHTQEDTHTTRIFWECSRCGRKECHIVNSRNGHSSIDIC